jgi:hypothetical protein
MHRLQEVLLKSNREQFSNAFTSSVLTKLSNCRTSAMGFHYYQCNDSNCNHLHYQYHSCKNRHCPTCNWQKQEQWQEARIYELLPVKYFHVVFTAPHELNALFLGNRTVLFKQLFDSASHCLLTLSTDSKWLGAMPSISAVLHTWGQQLSFHPHLHCIVSGGGVDKHCNWVDLKKKTELGFLFPYNVMEPMFKKNFLRSVNKMIESGDIILKDKSSWKQLKELLYNKKWIVYAKSPMGNASQVVEYLARYAHKVAISNHRIANITDEKVAFKYKDYADANKTKTMELSINEFTRRFEQHILPYRFVKIRHYGILGNFNRKKRINAILEKMNLPLHPEPVKVPYGLLLLEKFGIDITLCPKCKQGHLVLLNKVYPQNRGSPLQFKGWNVLLSN